MAVLGGLFSFFTLCFFATYMLWYIKYGSKRLIVKFGASAGLCLEFLSVTVSLVTSTQVLCKMTKRKRKERT